MTYSVNITPGAPPVLWSNLKDAFDQINENFELIAANLSGLGPGGQDFTNLNTDLIPAETALKQLGSPLKTWKSLYLQEWSDVPGQELNGVNIGSAQIKGIGSTIDLPSNSTVNGSLIIDPDKTFFKSVQVDNELRIEANEFADTLNLNSGTAVQLVVDSAGELITINNTGVTELTAGSAINVSASTGNITISNTGVTAVSAGAAVAGRTAGAGISVSAGTGSISITNTGVLQVQQGFGITVSTDSVTGIVTVSNSAPAQVAYRTVRVSGSADLVADSTSDILVVEAGYGMVVTTTEVSDDTLVLSVDRNIDITGSVYSNNSSIIVDSIDNKIYASGGFFGDLTGDTTGYHTGDIKGSVFSDGSTKLVDAVEGLIVGEVDTNTVTTENGVFIKNTNYSLFPDEGGDFYIRASSTDDDIIIRTNASGLGQYDFRFGKDGNLTVDGSANIGGTLNVGTIDTTDSSAITVVPPVTFQTSIIVDGNLTLKDNLILEKRLSISELEGSGEALAIYSDWAKDTGISIVSNTGLESVTLTSDRIVAVSTNFGPSQKDWIFETNGSITFPDTSNQTGAAISIAELKVLVAAAATYADFQTAIAAL
jgi:hypothetical protein